MSSIKKTYILEGLDCGNCANKIQLAISKLDGVKSINVDFLSKKMKIEARDEKVLEEAKAIVVKIESHVKVREDGYKIKHEGVTCHDGCCSKDSHEESHNHHGHSHDHGNEGNKELIKIGISAVIFLLAIIFKSNSYISIALFIISYIIIGGEVVLRALKNILRGQVFDENFLMTIATIGAFAIGEMAEGVGVMLFYSVGEYFQGRAVSNSRKNIAELMDIRPDYANLLVDDKEEKVSPEKVSIGDIIVIKPGEKVPLDGVIIEGKSMMDTSALTGESVPRSVEEGSDILGGFINKSGLLKVKVTKEFGESTVSKILDLVENASSKKAKAENFITKFARYYTPIVVIVAVLLAVIPPLVSGGEFSDWLYRALIFLVISCPCALVISIPLSFFGGIGGASKKGILIKGSNYLDILKDVDTVIFDKTGTITKGNFNVTKIESINIDDRELLKYVAYCESYSNHPIAISILKAFGEEVNKDNIKDYEEISGHGIKAKVFEKEVAVGNEKLMRKLGLEVSKTNDVGTIVHVSIDGAYSGYILIADEIKESSKEAIKLLRKLNIRETIMLTGDNKDIAENIGKEVGIDKIYSELLPSDKVEKMEETLKRNTSGKVAFVGDGVNDAPVLARADIGIAMGGLGSDAAIEAADVVIMTDELTKIASAIKISRKTKQIVITNIVFALVVKGIFLFLGAMGVATMWEAVFGDVGVAIIAILNAMKALKIKE